MSGSYRLAECRPLTKPGPLPTSFDALITRAHVDSVELDLCSPAADCVPVPLTITAAAPGIDLSHLRLGSYVHVELQLDENPFACTRAVYVTSIASWGGMKNPVDVGGRLYFAATDGSIGNGTILPFSDVRIMPTGCASLPPGTPAGCSTAIAIDDYSILFGSTAVGMGSTVDVVARSELYRVRNLRSFQSNFCDASWDWAWWAVVQDGLGAL